MMPDSDATAQDESTDEHDGPTMEISTDDVQATAQFTVTMPADVSDDDVPYLGGVEELVERRAEQHFRDTYNTRASTVTVQEKSDLTDTRRFDVVAMDGSSGGRRNSQEYDIPLDEEA